MLCTITFQPACSGLSFLSSSCKKRPFLFGSTLWCLLEVTDVLSIVDTGVMMPYIEPTSNLHCTYSEPRQSLKSEPHQPRGVQFCLKFPPNWFSFQPNLFWCTNMQFRNTLKKIIFIACKRFKWYKYYIMSMVISCSTCQIKEN